MQISFKAIIALLVVLLTACGGGSDDDKSPSLTSLQITGSESITVGMSESLHLKAHYSDGSEEDVTSATWSTSDSSLAAVNASGKVTAIAAGNVDISASYKGLEATQTIEVKAAQLVAMQILLEQESMPVGVTSQLKVIGSFNNNTSRELDLQVESSDVSIAGVDEVNVVTANSVGEVVLSAVQSGISAEQKLEVIEAQPLTAIVHAPMNIAKGTSNKAELFVSFTDGTTRPVQAKWQSESARVIQIDRAGMFTGFSHGESAISGAYENVLSNKVSITVTDALPVGIVVEPDSVSIPVGLTDKLSVLTLFSDNTQMIAEDAKFSDYDTQIIDIDSHGVITGLAKG
ncbi:Ig-like domain-containing protein, partial [Shewanella sp.]|uniref:Ig-like domain-containing protein n=1 Tax=Shewanella sp. TaxID=50422 RepID=UPI003D10C097